MSQIDLNTTIVPTGIDSMPQPGEAGQPHIENARVGHIPAEAREITAPKDARADVPAMNNELAGAAAPGREGFFSRIGHFFSNLGEKLFGQGFTLPSSITLTMPGGGNIEYPPARLVDMIKALPKAQRAEAANNIGQLLQDRLNLGHETLSKVYAGTAEPGPGTDTVANIMLYLEAKALQNGHSFTEGAFNIEDPAGRLFNWLNSSPERYQRSSSHLGYQTNVQVDGHLNTHRGIDIAQSPNGLTSGMNTLLFGTIPESRGSGRRLFLKMESHGCRLNTLNMFHRGDLAHGKTGTQPDRPIRASDFKSMIAHMFSFITSRGKGSAEGSRKERIPSTVLKAYQKVLDTADPNTPLGSTLHHLGSPKDNGSGIRIMIDNIQRTVADMDDKQLEAVGKFFHVLNSMEDTSHMDVRIGNEVIFDRNELV